MGRGPPKPGLRETGVGGWGAGVLQGCQESPGPCSDPPFWAPFSRQWDTTSQARSFGKLRLQGSGLPLLAHKFVHSGSHGHNLLVSLRSAPRPRWVPELRRCADWGSE